MKFWMTLWDHTSGAAIRRLRITTLKCRTPTTIFSRGVRLNRTIGGLTSLLRGELPLLPIVDEWCRVHLNGIETVVVRVPSKNVAVENSDHTGMENTREKEDGPILMNRDAVPLVIICLHRSDADTIVSVLRPLFTIMDVDDPATNPEVAALGEENFATSVVILVIVIVPWIVIVSLTATVPLKLTARLHRTI